jgi:hypothetical protein
MAVINWFHVFGVAPMLGYISYRNYVEKKLLQENFAIFLGILAVVLLIYHFYRGLTHKECKEE